MEFIGILFLATLVEGLITYLFGEKGPTLYSNRAYLRYVSLALGISLSIAYAVDIPAMVGLASDFSLVGSIVSGIIIGRGANYVNDIIGFIQTKR